MDTKTAVGAAGGISLTVAGAVSALVLTLGGGSAAADPSDSTPQDQVVEYVDQYGNPVALDEAPLDQATVPEIVVTTDHVPAMADFDVEMMASPDAEAGYGEGVEPEEQEDDSYDEETGYEEEDGDADYGEGVEPEEQAEVEDDSYDEEIEEEEEAEVEDDSYDGEIEEEDEEDEEEAEEEDDD